MLCTFKWHWFFDCPQDVADGIISPAPSEQPSVSCPPWAVAKWGEPHLRISHRQKAEIKLTLCQPNWMRWWSSSCTLWAAHQTYYLVWLSQSWCLVDLYRCKIQLPNAGNLELLNRKRKSRDLTQCSNPTAQYFDGIADTFTPQANDSDCLARNQRTVVMFLTLLRHSQNPQINKPKAAPPPSLESPHKGHITELHIPKTRSSPITTRSGRAVYAPNRLIQEA